MMFLNVLGVPPKDGSVGAQINVVVQSKMKLFYRPSGLPTYNQTNGWVEEVVATRSNGSLTLQNPTPYYVIIYAFSDPRGRTIEKDVILKPFGTETFKVNVADKFTMMIINDQGAGRRVLYNCQSGTCTGELEKK